MNLYDYQYEAIRKMKNGCILCGGVGSGKSRTAIGYYYIMQGGSIEPFEPMNDICAKDLYIITTAKKRDSKEWEIDLAAFYISKDPDMFPYNQIEIHIDSWNNISKYVDVENAFFIFDEQRLVGSGTWVKSFYKIAKKNEWVLLSATPGDCWSDYIPVFVANGFYKNKTQFKEEHMIMSNYAGYSRVERYVNTKRLIRLRDNILVNMNYFRKSITHHVDVNVEYDMFKYKDLMKNRWNYEEEKPIESASELCYQLRKIVNSHPSRLDFIYEKIKEKKRVIIFYNFDYELEILKTISCDKLGMSPEEFSLAEYNGHKHQDIPLTNNWVFLVQYTAGAEGWNCIKTDTIIFYSQNYSYKVMVQSSGRIDRLNTPYNDLYYYHLKSKANIDLAISKALKEKRKFNETKFIRQ